MTNMQKAATESLQKQSNANAGRELIKGREELEQIMKSMSSRIQEALPKHISPERIIRLAINAYSRTPKLAECSKTTLLGVIVKASELGLELDTLGQAYPVPFKNKTTGRLEAQLIIGYPGLIELGMRSGRISKWEAHNVYEKDEFSFEYGTNEHLTHKPSMNPDRGPLVACYSLVRFKDGVQEFLVMTKFEIEKVRARSQQKDGMLWTDNYDEAARKTVIRRHAKTLPKSPELAQAVKIDELAYAGKAQEIDISKVTDTGEIPVAEFEDVEETLPAQLPKAQEPTDPKKSVVPETPAHAAEETRGNEFTFLRAAIVSGSKKSLETIVKRMADSKKSGLLIDEEYTALLSLMEKREEELAKRP